MMADPLLAAVISTPYDDGCGCSGLGCRGQVSMTERSSSGDAAWDGCLLAGGCEHRVREL